MAKGRGGTQWQVKIDAVAKKLSNATAVDIGWLPDAKYPDGTQVALVAAIQQFGAPSRGIPPRPFFSEMITEQSPAWPAAVKATLTNNDGDTAAMLEDMGALIAGQLAQKINTFVGVPLAPSTIARKGHDKQLIDTAHMLNTVDYIVKK